MRPGRDRVQHASRRAGTRLRDLPPRSDREGDERLRQPLPTCTRTRAPLAPPRRIAPDRDRYDGLVTTSETQLGHRPLPAEIRSHPREDHGGRRRTTARQPKGVSDEARSHSLARCCRCRRGGVRRRLPAVGSAQRVGDTSSGGITVLGTGFTNVTPDRASFAFGTVSQAVTANAALAASSQSVARVIAALKKAGVAQADIQTTDVSLSPRMNDNGNDIVGYTASNTVTATIKKIGDAGDVVDAAVGAGANQVSGPNLLASDQDAAYRNALKEAVADARTKAETLATASSSTLGKVTAIVEGGGAIPMPLAAGAKDSSVAIE